jgi:hypothetical protein
VVVAVVVVGSLVLLTVVWDADSETSEFELVKALLQVLIVVFTGALLAFLAQEYQSRQKIAVARRTAELRERDDRRSQLFSVLNRTTRAYTDLKRARRLLRAQARRRGITGAVVMRTPYDVQMMSISNTQLEIESLAAAVIDQRHLFGNPADLIALYKRLDDGVAALITEYESQRPLFGPRAVRAARHFPAMASFLGKDPFREVSGPYHRVQSTLRADVRATREDSTAFRSDAARSG